MTMHCTKYTRVIFFWQRLCLPKFLLRLNRIFKIIINSHHMRFVGWIWRAKVLNEVNIWAQLAFFPFIYKRGLESWLHEGNREHVEDLTRDYRKSSSTFKMKAVEERWDSSPKLAIKRTSTENLNERYWRTKICIWHRFATIWLKEIINSEGGIIRKNSARTDGDLARID